MAERTRRGKTPERIREGKSSRSTKESSERKKSTSRRRTEESRVEKKREPKKSSRSRERTTKDLYDDDYENRDTGFKGSRVLDTSDYPDVKWYSVKEGKNEIDIIPYEVASDKHPKSRPIGELDYKILVSVHRFIGANKDSVLCLQDTYGKPCSICEERQRMIDSDEYDYKDKEVKKLKPSERVFYNVIDLLGDSNEVMLFESSNFEFQKELIEEAEQGRDTDGEIIPFAELRGGYSIKFRGSEREGEFKSSKSFKPKGFKFIDRDDYEEDILDETMPLDEMLIIPTYDEVKKLVGEISFDDDDDNDDDDDEPKKSRRSRSRNRDDDEEDEEDDKKSKRSSRRKGKGKDDGLQECPAGGVFGEDTDTLDDCEDCEIWKACSKAYEEG